MDTRLEEAILRDASSWSGERCEAMRDWHANGRLTEEHCAYVIATGNGFGHLLKMKSPLLVPLLLAELETIGEDWKRHEQLVREWMERWQVYKSLALSFPYADRRPQSWVALFIPRDAAYGVPFQTDGKLRAAEAICLTTTMNLTQAIQSHPEEA